MFSLSLLWFMRVIITVSKAHRNLTLHFPGFTSDGAFSVTAATPFFVANLESHSWPMVINVVSWAGKQAA